MGERDFSPLSTACVRALNDKLYEKRKNAAMEIERMVKELSAQNNSVQIHSLLRVLGNDFVLSQNPNSRKGGLIGLAATAIAMGKDSSLYVSELVKPVLACFYDYDSRVRYFACESLYNIVKVARGSVLPFFNDIFDGLSRLAADPDQNVRNGAELLDRLMKDIVTESSSFDLTGFLPLLRERIYTRNQFARQFIVSWVSVLDAVPGIDMLGYLPEILDGLFHILGDNNTEIRKMCEASLGEFLQGMSKSPQKVNYSGMVNILIAHSQNPDDVIKYTAITWLKEFVHISGRTMLPFAAGIITAVLPCLSYSDNGRKSIRDASRAVNNNLMRLIGPEDDGEILPSKESKDNKDVEEKDESKGDSNMDKDVMAVVNHILDTNNKNGEAIDYNTNMITLDVSSMVEVLTRQLLHESMQTRIAALRWIYHLHIKTPNKIFEHVEELFPLLLKTLSDPSDEVVLLDLEVLAEISSSPAGQRRAPFTDATMTIPSLVKHAVESSHSMNGYFTKFMISLLNLFSTDRQLLEDRGSFIIRQLCLLLNAEDIYRCCSEILLHEEDMKFASHMIQTLSAILLTSTELFDLRTQLKELKTEESCSLFCCLYNSWCHNPVATVALCLLTQNYQHTCALLQLFGDLEVTVEFLTEIDKLVQLIESPIFTYLRLQLLDVQHNQHLIKSLYGLLMLLPQSDAFQTLRHRLECVPHFHFPSYDKNIETTENTNDHKPASKHIDFEELLKHFKAIQSKHRASRRLPRTMET